MPSQRQPVERVVAPDDTASVAKVETDRIKVPKEPVAPAERADSSPAKVAPVERVQHLALVDLGRSVEPVVQELIPRLRASQVVMVAPAEKVSCAVAMVDEVAMAHPVLMARKV